MGNMESKCREKKIKIEYETNKHTIGHATMGSQPNASTTGARERNGSRVLYA